MGECDWQIDGAGDNDIFVVCLVGKLAYQVGLA